MAELGGQAELLRPIHHDHRRPENPLPPRSPPEPDATPLILTHGWPSTVVEYKGHIDELTRPPAHGGDPADAFHVVIHRYLATGSLVPLMKPGGIATGSPEPGRAHAPARLRPIRRSRERWWALVSPELGRIAPDHVIGVHVTQIFSFPSGDPAEFEGLGEDDFLSCSSCRPSTTRCRGSPLCCPQAPERRPCAGRLPAGQLAWSGQLFGDARARTRSSPTFRSTG